MLYGDAGQYTGDGLVSVDGVYCFTWPDTSGIQHVMWTDCAATGNLSVAMSLDRFNEFIAAAQAAGPTPANSFYADSTEMFYLGMAAVVAVWAAKAIAYKIFFAS